ncbi:MerR family transcriptional regulator [Sinomonas cyclohexanicum]|uniref:MerR family transcriptional regulator n=1 Tax=Sinomonas cyclohexanicum TaxID=322009 RepID=A0ABM7PQP4_SINCY|nr:MerR family transcriptional regulator [Corynebacterium cyclohexanicum]BCT74376.1 MerR family transcriptional regulator [Corynebacterium cyclohexanicum]
MDWSIQEVAKLAGTTSRTLRHYGSIGLLEPTRTGHNGYRYYDEDALVRLQRILLLRELGLGLEAIADVLAHQTDPVHALRTHLDWLRQERERLARQARAVEMTIRQMEGGGQLMAQDMFDGFDHTQYKDEVEERWGKKAYADSDAWWRGLGPDGQKAWQDRVAQLSADWQAAFAAGEPHDGAAAQALAARHVQWLAGIPGTPGYPDGPAKEYVLGLADMYVADPRFAKNYGGTGGAAFVRDALHAYADREL